MPRYLRLPVHNPQQFWRKSRTFATHGAHSLWRTTKTGPVLTMAVTNLSQKQIPESAVSHPLAQFWKLPSWLARLLIRILKSNLAGKIAMQCCRLRRVQAAGTTKQ